MPRSTNLLGTLQCLLMALILKAAVSGGQDAVDVVSPPPFIHTQGAEVVLSTGANLTLRCTGHEELSWTVPVNQHQDPPLADRMVIYARVSDSEHESTLYVEDTIATDTGLYVCSYGNNSAEHQSRAEVYVYASDPDELFVHDHVHTPLPGYIMMPISQGVANTIPCRPSHPDAQVTLWKAAKKVELDDNVSFDPKEGFYIKYPTSYFNGGFECRAVLDGVSDSITIQLFFRAGTSVPQPEISIDLESKGTVLVGERFSLRCSVIVSPGTSAHMSWTYSSGENSNRIRETPPELKLFENDGVAYEEIFSSLTVSDVRKTDEGAYRCTVTTHDSKTGFTEQIIYVIEKTYAYLTPYEREVEVMTGAEEVDLSVSIEAYPWPELTWLKNGEPIPLDDRHYDIGSRQGRAKLKIFEPLAGDAATYTLHGRTRDMNASESIVLYINEVPTAELVLPASSPHYQLEQYYTLACHFTGFPKPQVFWNWQPCRGLGCQVDPFDWTPVSTSLNIPDITVPAPGVSELFLKSVESGFYQCHVRNKIGGDSVDTAFIATSIAGGFGHVDLETGRQENYLNLVAGDPLRVACKASRFTTTHRPTLSWMYNNLEIDLQNTTGLALLEQDTTLDYVTVVDMPSVDREKQGTYYCRAETNTGRQNTFFNLQVRPVTEPVFTHPLDGYSIQIPGADVTLECKANGIPQPTITWYKDDVIFTGRNGSGFVDSRITFGENNTRVTVRELLESDAAVYACEAMNRGGSIRSNITLMVKVVEDPGGLSSAQIGAVVGCLLAALVLVALIALLVRRYVKPRYVALPLEEYLRPVIMAEYNPDMPIDEQTDCLAYDPKWEVPKSKLKFDIILGQGAFGKVMRAEADGLPLLPEGHPTRVAVKMVKDAGDREQLKALLSELKVLIHIGQHLNLVNLLGAVTKELERGHLYVIVEYCRYGNMRHYLLKKRKDFVDTMDDTVKRKAAAAAAKEREAQMVCIPIPEDGDCCDVTSADYTATSDVSSAPTCTTYMNTGGSTSMAYTRDPASPASPVTSALSRGASSAASTRSTFGEEDDLPLITKDLTCFAFQVARGMEYLSSRKYIHRDLAARNVLLADDNVVKICDFGLAKDCYKYSEYKKTSDAPVPIKWMALESLTHKVYTTQSDVWSYGVLLWELFTLGRTPYPAVDLDESFVERLKRGYRLEKPENASDEVYNCMRHCWDATPERRPNFTDLGELFGNILQDGVKQHYIDLEGNYFRVRDGGAARDGYLQMRGMSEYLPMTPVDAETEPAAKDGEPKVTPCDPANAKVTFGNEYVERPSRNQSTSSKAHDAGSLPTSPTTPRDENCNTTPPSAAPPSRQGSNQQNSAGGKPPQTDSDTENYLLPMSQRAPSVKSAASDQKGAPRSQPEGPTLNGRASGRRDRDDSARPPNYDSVVIGREALDDSIPV